MIYDQKFLRGTLGILIALVVILMATGGTGYVLLLPFAFGAFFQRKPEQILFWVAISMTVVMGNPYLMPKNQVFLLAQRVMVMSFGFLMILQIASRRKHPCVSPLLLLYPYLLFMTLSSAFGWSPLISFLKLFLFIVVYAAYLGIANEAAQSSRATLPKLRAMVLAIATFYIAGSIFLIPFPGISQLSAEQYLNALRLGQDVKSLFMGMSIHSQALGPMITMLTVFLFSDWAFSVRRFSRLHAILLVLCPILIYKTSSRTAMGGMLLGLVCVSICLARERGIGVRWRAKIRNATFGVLAVCTIVVLAIPATRDRIVRFALKWDPSAEVSDFNVEGLVSTRQGKVESQMYYFKKSPVLGNGFQVSADMINFKSRHWTDLLSAPVEKGVWITAILEEGGLVGFSLFLLFLIPASLQLLMRHAYMAFSMLFTMMVLNMGEFTLFSMSAVGGFAWMLVFVAAAFDALRLRDDQLGVYQWHG